ncbi:MAG: adenylate/guanylate cyclase domain-containing protein [Chloroflexi bacterium]|nr:adenylate/guanylate cyclase domain-containing protein [Chloroflexota bacterium]
MYAPVGSREELRRLLRRYNEEPDQWAQIAAAIEQRFQRRVAILVLDSSGFSRTVRSVGIVHFLALLERLELLVRPCVESCDGRILRAEADNIFAVFPHPERAVRAALAAMRSLRMVNDILPKEDEIYASIGIGYGPVLLVGDHDVYGDEMNLACKLGEDLAQREEIVLTASAWAALDAGEWPFQEQHYSISGIEIAAYLLAYTP